MVNEAGMTGTIDRSAKILNEGRGSSKCFSLQIY
jgi:hypothetical protein